MSCTDQHSLSKSETSSPEYPAGTAQGGGNGPSTNHQPHVYSMTCCGSEDYERTAIIIDLVICKMNVNASSRQDNCGHYRKLDSIVERKCP